MKHRQDPITETLSGLAPFRGCGGRQLRGVTRWLTPHRATAGTVLMDEGRVGREVVVIASGRALVRKAGQPIAELGPGDVCGEMAVLDHGVRTATVVAETDLDVFVMSAQEFRSLLATYPSVEHHVIRTLSARLRRADRELAA